MAPHIDYQIEGRGGIRGWIEGCRDAAADLWDCCAAFAGSLLDALGERPLARRFASRLRSYGLAAVGLACAAGWAFVRVRRAVDRRFPGFSKAEARIRRGCLRIVHWAARAYSELTWARVGLLTVLMFSFIAMLDSVSGYVASVRALYVLPIWLATRLAGVGAGLVSTACVSFFVAHLDSLYGVGEEPFLTHFAVRLGSFGSIMLVIAHVESALRVARQRALHDPLTGLANRHQIEICAARAFARHEGSKRPPLIAVLDCDGFKEMNDAFGHAFGDHALQVLARRLANNTREVGVAGRLGGDEFVVLFEDCTAGQARARLAKACEAFSRQLACLGYRTSVSYGLAAFGADGTTFDALCRVADIRMYEAKRSASDGAATIALATPGRAYVGP